MLWTVGPRPPALLPLRRALAIGQAILRDGEQGCCVPHMSPSATFPGGTRRREGGANDRRGVGRQGVDAKSTPIRQKCKCEEGGGREGVSRPDVFWMQRAPAFTVCVQCIHPGKKSDD